MRFMGSRGSSILPLWFGRAFGSELNWVSGADRSPEPIQPAILNRSDDRNHIQAAPETALAIIKIPTSTIPTTIV